MKRSMVIVVAILAAFAIGGGAFWGGMNVGKAQANNDQAAFLASRGAGTAGDTAGGTGATGGTGGFAGGAGGFGGGAGGAGGARGQRGATGTITKIEGNTITMTDAQGATVTVTMADNVPIVKTVLGDKSDLKAGVHILAAGTRSGNNVAATQIQLTDRPPGTGNPFGGGGRGTPTPTPTTK